MRSTTRTWPAYITGLAEPVYGRAAHAAAMQQMLRMFPDMHVYSDPYPIQFGAGDWITVVTNATGTFTGEITLPDGTVIAPTGKDVRRRVRPDHQVGRRPAHRHLRVLGRRSPAAPDRPRLATRPGWLAATGRPRASRPAGQPQADTWPSAPHAGAPLQLRFLNHLVPVAHAMPRALSPRERLAVMELSPFRIERFYAQYEHSTRFMLSSSDCQSRTIAELLELEPDSHERLLECWCGYTESPGGPELRRAIALLYERTGAAEVVVASCAEEGIFLLTTPCSARVIT